MAPTAHLALQLIDPRGRCSRRGLLLAAAVLLVLQALAAFAVWAIGGQFGGWPALAIDAAFCWAGFATVSKRLHDLDRSAWWLPTAALVWLAGAVSLVTVVVLAADSDVLVSGTATYWLVFAGMMLPLLVCAMWLHIGVGGADANRFGPAPGAWGFSMPPRAASWQAPTVGTQVGVA